MKSLVLVLGILGIASGQSASKALLTNLDTAKWSQEKGGLESAFLREDSATGGMEMLVRFPGGHVIAPHSHESNERLIVVEGQLTVRQDEGDTVLNSGGFAYLPAHEVQRLSCSSKTRCTFYLAWDGNPAARAAK
jgi:quercetin dioxygenase-like cupin family protein